MRPRWLFIAAIVCGAAVHAQTPPAQPQPTAPSAPNAPPAGADRPGAGVPDEGLIEFLGSNDVGDAAWWEFLKRAPPRGINPPPAPPPQEAKR